MTFKMILNTSCNLIGLCLDVWLRSDTSGHNNINFNSKTTGFIPWSKDPRTARSGTAQSESFVDPCLRRLWLFLNRSLISKSDNLLIPESSCLKYWTRARYSGLSISFQSLIWLAYWNIQSEWVLKTKLMEFLKSSKEKPNTKYCTQISKVMKIVKS